MSRRCRTHSDGDLEAQLVADGLGAVLREILTELSVRGAHELGDDALPELLRADKTTNAAALAARIRANPDVAQKGPAAFREAVGDLRGLR